MEISKDELKLVMSYIGKLQDTLSHCGNPEHYLDSDELEELDKEYSMVYDLFNRLLGELCKENAL